MKLILLIAIVGFSSSYAFLPDSEYGEKLLTYTKIWHNKCIPITGATQASIDEMKNGSFVDNEIIKRYTLCLWIVSGVMNPDMTLNTGSLKGLLPPKLAARMNTYLECVKVAQKSDLPEQYDKVWGMMKCVYNANPTDFVMF